MKVSVFRKWIEEDSPCLFFDHEGTERWMSKFVERVENGMSKTDIVKNSGKIAHELLENLLYNDYLDWLFWVVSCIESGPEKVGTYAEFSENSFMTKDRLRKRKLSSSLRKRSKRLKVSNAGPEDLLNQGYLEMPKLEDEQNPS